MSNKSILTEIKAILTQHIWSTHLWHAGVGSFHRSGEFWLFCSDLD